MGLICSQSTEAPHTSEETGQNRTIGVPRGWSNNLHIRVCICGNSLDYFGRGAMVIVEKHA